MGDLNAHNALWGSQVTTNANGRIIADSLEDLDLVCCNDGRSTRITLPGQNASAVDLTLISSEIVNRCQWDVLEDSGGSDHFPTMCKIQTQIQHTSIQKSYKRNIKNANWEKYCSKIEELMKSGCKEYSTFTQIMEKLKQTKELMSMRAICGTKWGSDPNILLSLYKGIVRSHLDYAANLLNPCSKSLMMKLEQVQNVALRIITGCLRSTPILILQAECSVSTLKVRREILAHKYILKQMSEKNNIVIRSLNKLNEAINANNQFWKNKAIPDYSLAYTDILKKSKIIRYQINPIYEVERKILLYPITINSLEYEKYEIESNEMFLAKYGGIYSNHTYVYTDGSIDPQTNQSGFGIYIPQINYKFSSRLHNYTQICTTEMIAIYKAISVCIEKGIMKAVIFADSKSALSKISSLKWDQMDYVTIMTKKLLVEANNMGFSIGIEWVPGHQGIKGNEVADRLANIGRELRVPYNIKNVSTDIFCVTKKDILTQFYNEWHSQIKHKDPNYCRLQCDFPIKPWYAKCGYMGRNTITNINRLRSGHCKTPCYLYKIGKRKHRYVNAEPLEQ
ncbi:LOW QUALITY PROTEIN: uncharacterized protein [Diabrotica undecimpunctata]|uniref:LOW QUALITY PROTEIN: uncharacterized protein n=1 Tax=Diabrotica undecimpunctata TaxID=50387 RepID=UPI003B63D589